MTLREAIERRESLQRWRARTRPTDGRFISILKRAFGLPVFGKTWIVYTRRRYRHVLDHTIQPTEAQNRIRWAIDEHALIWMGILLIVYLSVFLLAAVAVGRAFSLIITGLLLFPLFRLCEIMFIVVQLFLGSRYVSSVPMRATLRTFWHYLETAVAFAILYVAAFNFGDSFQNQQTSVQVVPFIPGSTEPITFRNRPHNPPVLQFRNDHDHWLRRLFAAKMVWQSVGGPRGAHGLLAPHCGAATHACCRPVLR